MKFRLNFLFFYLIFFGIACKQKETPRLFKLTEQSGIDFSNNIQNTAQFNIFSYRNFYNGGGVAIGDVNNDGLSDVFFTANMSDNKLYLNKGNWHFDDITGKAGISKKKEDWSTGVVMVDINNDGWLDIYVCNAGYINGIAPESKLYINNHNLTFTDSANEYGLTNHGGYTTHAAFFDYDLDGDLDCFIINNSFIPVNTLNYANTRSIRAKDWPVADFLKGGGDHLLRNDNGKFVDVSNQSGIHGSLISFGLGVSVGDINGDAFPDIYVSNDFFERDYFYINQTDGTFKDELEERMQHTSLASMGSDIADINNDGYPDIFTTDMLPNEDYRLKTTTSFENFEVNKIKVNSGFYNQYMQNTLQVNNKNGKFTESAYYSGVASSDWSWGGLIFDADNDGLSDIYVCNGIYHDVTDQDFIDFFANNVIQRMVMTGKKDEVDSIISKMPSHPVPNRAFKNLGNLKFSDEAFAWGLDQPSFSNGAAYGDLDNDGDLDLVVNNVNQKSFVYRNYSRETNQNSYIGISLKGINKNVFAIGSNIKVFSNNQILTREIMPSRGFQSSVDYKAIFGIGKSANVDSIIISWPDRSLTKITNPALNKVHIIEQKNAVKIPSSIRTKPEVMFEKVVQDFAKHNEDDYLDFYNERGVPMLLSREGPKAAYGDVNGDGLTDIYIGGATNQPRRLYLQTSEGFIQKQQQAFDVVTDFEDVAALFFDCDKDGDLDLFIGSGGNNHPPFSREFQNRLYKNDGKGNFEIEVKTIANTGMNTSVVSANDFENDGDLDLFVGSRSVPQNYGRTPLSFLLVNNGNGKFIDIAKSENSGISTMGMITGAVWADVAGNKQKELIITGEWMAPHIFSYKDGHFVEIKSNLNDLTGWWKTIAASDLDGDGDDDLVLGNLGENFYLHPDAEKPAKMFINDFDNNGSKEKIITQTIDGEDKPVFLKRDVVEQIASLRKQNLKYIDFASKSIQQLFSPAVINKSEVKQFNYSASCIAINNGDGKFAIKKMPYQVQLSCVNAIKCTDLNDDGMTDIILGGNQFGFLPQFSRLDASYGHVLINKGKGEFEWIGSQQSGIYIPGEIKDIVELDIKGKKNFLFLQNNDYPVLYQLKGKKRESK